MNGFLDYLQHHPLAPENEPLTDARCDELFELFDDDSLPDTTMSAETADGYLAACVVGPLQVPAHQWMQAIFGQPMVPVCADSARQHRLQRLLLGRHRDIDTATSLAHADTTISNIYTPLTSEVAAAGIISPFQLDSQGGSKRRLAAQEQNVLRRLNVRRPLYL